MNGEIPQHYAIAGLLLIVGLCIWIYYAFFDKKKKLVAESKARYDAAIEGGDKKEALAAGRIYYSALRGGKLTIYDEQAIANDLNAMKQI